MNQEAEDNRTASIIMDSDNVTRIPNQSPPAYLVRIPEGIRGGQQFPVTIQGQQLTVTCPNMARPGMLVRIIPPPPPDGGVTSPVQKLVPASDEIELSYNINGWVRTIRQSDMKFQWKRVDENGAVIDTKPANFDMENSAYVVDLECLDNDYRMRRGEVRLVTIDEGGLVDSGIRGSNGMILVSYPDIDNAQKMSYDYKVQWFQDTCSQLCVEWNEGHMRLNVRREYLLSDSLEAVMSLSTKDLRKVWRFEFIGEAGIDAGGWSREWFDLVTKELFDPNLGLWQTSKKDKSRMTINPASGEFFLHRVGFLSS